MGSLALLRKPLKMRFNQESGEPVDQLVGETAIAGSERCRVERVVGLTLEIRS